VSCIYETDKAVIVATHMTYRPRNVRRWLGKLG
jgi:hypothetical protein